ncbi:regulator of chromosome condensation 1/beta-lactamase-inhibitor protein II, partial [Baffinella frigidus]
LSCGNGHCCMLFPCVGKVKCWGQNNQGQLGLNDKINRGSSTSQMGAGLPYLGFENARNVVCSYSSTCIHLEDCARMHTGDVKCWGYNNGGQLGYNDKNDRGETAGSMGDLLPFVNLGSNYAIQVASGSNFRHFLLDNGETRGAGYNGQGALGIEVMDATIYLSNTKNALVVTTPTLLTIKQVSIGFSICALLSDGTCKCFGGGSYALGYGDTLMRGRYGDRMGLNLPIIDFGSSKIVSIAGGATKNTCALTHDGTMRCWGSNTYGQLAQG